MGNVRSSSLCCPKLWRQTPPRSDVYRVDNNDDDDVVKKPQKKQYS
uniref:Uncharacterized protein n=1 Tax=Romanomermis culicivorax TaxID=13658 RepID=A0A915IZC6_ROMCU